MYIYIRIFIVDSLTFVLLIFFQASKKQKLFLMLWCPDTATVKRKMVYSSSFDALKKALHGVSKTIQVTIQHFVFNISYKYYKHFISNIL